MNMTMEYNEKTRLTLEEVVVALEKHEQIIRFPLYTSLLQFPLDSQSGFE